MDTGVLPAIATILMDTAAILSLVTVWLRHERSILNIVTLVVTMLAGLFFTFVIVGQGIGGA